MLGRWKLELPLCASLICARQRVARTRTQTHRHTHGQSKQAAVLIFRLFLLPAWCDSSCLPDSLCTRRASVPLRKTGNRRESIQQAPGLCPCPLPATAPKQHDRGCFSRAAGRPGRPQLGSCCCNLTARAAQCKDCASCSGCCSCDRLAAK